ncbi:MAG: thioredoxin domain-containing protein [Planctomycetota bacterium]|nr:thioredoxin domain-containing protein [Planctomycetota bacterium]
MNRKQGLATVAGIIALLAAWTSGSLLMLHAEKDADLGLLAGICAAGDEGCASVVNSRWGVLPFEGEGQQRSGDGIPVAALGFLYYSLLAAWYLLIGVPDPGRQWLARGVLWLNALGMLGSIFYTGVMLWAIGTPCYLCLLTHGCNGAILLISWWLRPVDKSHRAVGVPSNRLLIAATSVVLLACVAQFQIYQAGVERTNSSALREETETLRQLARDVEKLETLHRNQTKIETGVRKDDPIIDDVGGLHYQLVIFSDVECPNCARFDQYLKDTILPIWNGHLEVVWKHFPNTSEHPNAMRGAQALEAARLQGKFWEMRDWLLPRRATLGAVRWTDAAAALEMDADRFTRDMASRSVSTRIGQDMALARKAKIRGTPGVYLNGRMVSRLVRRSAGFWEIQSDSLREIRSSKGQDW